MGSSPVGLRTNATRDPSAATRNNLGSPTVKRWVRAYWRGKLSVTGRRR